MPFSSDSCKVMQQLASKSCADALRMKLHTIQRKRGVSNALYHPVCCCCTVCLLATAAGMTLLQHGVVSSLMSAKVGDVEVLQVEEFCRKYCHCHHLQALMLNTCLLALYVQQ